MTRWKGCRSGKEEKIEGKHERFSAAGFPCRLRFLRLTNEVSTYNFSMSLRYLVKRVLEEGKKTTITPQCLTFRSDHLKMTLFPKSKFWSFLFRANSSGRVCAVQRGGERIKDG